MKTQHLITALICGMTMIPSAAVSGQSTVPAPFSGYKQLEGPDTITGPVIHPDSLPSYWTIDRNFNPQLPSESDWWKSFGDPTLTALVELAEKQNYDLQTMAHRIEMARLSWESARSSYFPTITAAAGWNRAQSAGRVSGSSASPASSYFSLGANLSWELDIFGRVAAQSKAGKADYKVTQAQYNSAMISLAANVAKAYFNLRSTQMQIESTIEDIRSQEKIVSMTETRFNVGLVSKLDVAQARTVLYSSQAELPRLEGLETAAINSLAMLTGMMPGNLADQLSTPSEPTLLLPDPFRVVNTGVPADLLRRRPDIIEAENQLAAYAAQLGLAKKEFLPTLSISGYIGTESHRLDGLFKSHSLAYNVAPTLSWTIFDGMARSYKTAQAREQMLAGIESYNNTVTQAYCETLTALNTYSADLRQITMLRQVNVQCAEELHLSVERYKQGLASFNDVANAQISVLNYKNNLIQARASALDALVEIYVALGGDF